MVSRLQFLLNENRVALSTPFAVGAAQLHTNADKPQEAYQLDKLRTQLLTMRRICSEKEGARPGASHSVTISGKLDESGKISATNQDDLCMALIMAAYWQQKHANKQLYEAVQARFI